MGPSESLEHARPGRAAALGLRRSGPERSVHRRLVRAGRHAPVRVRGAHWRGFVDEIVLVSDTDPNHVSAISFWRSKEDAEGFYATGFERVSALLQPFLSARPERHEFVVGASTNSQIWGWES